jgi:hypothetical protein
LPAFYFLFLVRFSEDDFDSLDFDSEDFESEDLDSPDFDSADFESLELPSDFDPLSPDFSLEVGPEFFFA